MITSVQARVKRVTSLTRQATKLAPKLVESARTATKKPTQREDYIETKRMFISKSFIVLGLLALIVAGVLFYYLAWPWLQSRYFVANFVRDDDKLAAYSGRVRIYERPGRETLLFEGRLEDGLRTGKATEYDTDGVIAYSGGFAEDVYEGTGELYEGGVLLYSGGFASGEYSGHGTVYAPDGTVRYQGAFANGVYSGQGRLYSGDGTLIYDGAFAGGLYSGEGTQYGEDGELAYKGEFASGLRSGTGTMYSDGTMTYKGGFAEDLPMGEGTAFYPDGTAAYKGGFEAGEYSGDGTAYDERGVAVYSGGFLEGEYSGTGTMYLSPTERLTGSFEGGAPVGIMELYKSGVLSYSGSCDGAEAEGFGTIYSAKGAALYAGEMTGGTVDPRSVVGATADEVRAMLEGGAVTEMSDAGRGFSITSRLAGLTVYSSYKQADGDPTVYCLYQYDPHSADGFVSTVPWEGAEQLSRWMDENGFDVLYSDSFGPTAVEFPAGVPFEPGEYPCTVFYMADMHCYAWDAVGDGSVSVVEWRSTAILPTGGAEVESAASVSRLDSLLAKLDVADEQTMAQVGGAAPLGGAAGQSTPENEYYNTKNAEGLLAKAAETGVEYTIYSQLLSYFENAELKACVDDSLALMDVLIADEQAAVSMGGDGSALRSLEGERAALELKGSKHALAMERAALIVEGATGLDPADYKLNDLIFMFDPLELDMAALAEAVDRKANARTEQAEAPADGSDSQAAEEAPGSGEQSPTGGENAAARLEMNILVLDIEESYQEFWSAMSAYYEAYYDEYEAGQSYLTGSISSEDYYRARMTTVELGGGIYTALVKYMRQCMALNELSGGAVSQQFGIYPGVFGK